MVGIIIFYRRWISPYTRSTCRFHPTCSQYALTAFRRFGFLRGTVLVAWRILRCNPFGKGGQDPVPERFILTTKRRNHHDEKNG